MLIAIIFFLVVTLPIAGAVMIRLGLWPARKGDEPHCAVCDYTLIGIQSDRCPECGTLLSPDQYVRGSRWQRPLLIWIGSGLILLGPSLIPKLTSDADLILLLLADIAVFLAGIGIINRGCRPRVGDEPHCPGCDGPLAGVEGGPCPKCGWLIDPKAIVRGDSRFRPWLVLAGAGVILLSVVWPLLLAHDSILELITTIAVLVLPLAGLVQIKRGFWPLRDGDRLRVGDLPHCRHCDYLLIGINPDRCPECGTPLTIAHGERTRWPGPAVFGGVVLLLLVPLSFVTFDAVAAPHIGPNQQPRVVKAAQDISNLGLALDGFHKDCGRFPTTAEGLSAMTVAPPGIQGWKSPYIDAVPVDPWGRAYIYACPGSHGKNYDLISVGADGVEGNNDNITN